MGLAAPLRTGSRRTRTWHAIGAVRRPANLGGPGTSRGPNGSRDAAGGLRPPPGCQARGGRAEGAPPVGRSMPRRRLKIRPVPWHRLQIRPVVKVAASRLGCAAARAPWCCPWHWQRLAKAAASRLGCVCAGSCAGAAPKRAGAGAAPKRAGAGTVPMCASALAGWACVLRTGCVQGPLHGGALLRTSLGRWGYGEHLYMYHDDDDDHDDDDNDDDDDNEDQTLTTTTASTTTTTLLLQLLRRLLLLFPTSNSYFLLLLVVRSNITTTTTTSPVTTNTTPPTITNNYVAQTQLQLSHNRYNATNPSDKQINPVAAASCCSLLSCPAATSCPSRPPSTCPSPASDLKCSQNTLKNKTKQSA